MYPTDTNPVVNLQFSRTGLELLLSALGEAYVNVPSRTDMDAFIDAQMQRISRVLNNQTKA